MVRYTETKQFNHQAGDLIELRRQDINIGQHYLAIFNEA
jgi:hypothetical protein